MKLYSLTTAIVRQTFGILLAMLREIFDEAAYTRFLARAGVASSSESYAAFRREFEEAKAHSPRCC
jgi:hypothetical protein